MTELVFLKSKQALTTSLKVAEAFQKPHDEVLKSIRRLEKDMGGLVKKSDTPLFIATTHTNKQNGQSYPMYLMNRDGFALLAMGFTGKKALAFKLDFIKAFNAMEQILLQQQNERWREIRAAGKVGNRAMCDTIHDVIIPLAREQGSAAPEKVFYWHYQKAVNKAAGVKPKSRDELPLGQLYEIEKLQHIVDVSIRGLAARGDGYKQIYQNTNQTLENYSRLSLITERFLTA